MREPSPGARLLCCPHTRPGAAPPSLCHFVGQPGGDLARSWHSHTNPTNIGLQPCAGSAGAAQTVPSKRSRAVGGASPQGRAVLASPSRSPPLSRRAETPGSFLLPGQRSPCAVFWGGAWYLGGDLALPSKHVWLQLGPARRLSGVSSSPLSEHNLPRSPRRSRWRRRAAVTPGWDCWCWCGTCCWRSASSSCSASSTTPPGSCTSCAGKTPEGEREKLWLLCFRGPSHLTLLQTQEKTEPRKNQWQLQTQPFLVEYDKLGFLLNLDSKLPPELASRYANFSEGVCKPGYASALMTVIFPKFSKPAPMFLDDSFRRWARIRDFVPPFGIKGQDNLIKAILSATKDYRLTPALDSLSCRRCIIVGNGGVLANKSLGLKIDDYDVVVRLNSAPVKGFEKDVGGKTTLRITYPEGAIQKMEQYEKDSLFVLAGFKWQDFKWLKYIVYKEKVSASDGFWKSVATRVPREPHEIRILNPYFIQEAAFSFIGLPFNNGLMGRGSWTHNIQREKEFLRKLVKARVITDLTSGI
ncbi:CMP-N-acetylneuraminate-beta-1,4-galactoside alpha-2,3-sialyltransferase isoform X2 [Anser cygnoides]|uniref:CMP-N-acetylneuraminate-beta-1,4-galactoside alpha-2,3-sialyltransferase isoform X2 n=1 Tax=Anser cygnoides TaxID=8845 RepID=UPI0020093395|nr:CMP-N-acetylneuraminate-beta-1,4-galactoside alpha-2,3-sialyltransferase isoform X2 [Anser cygnoides]